MLSSAIVAVRSSKYKRIETLIRTKHKSRLKGTGVASLNHRPGSAKIGGRDRCVGAENIVRLVPLAVSDFNPVRSRLIYNYCSKQQSRHTYAASGEQCWSRNLPRSENKSVIPPKKTLLPSRICDVEKENTPPFRLCLQRPNLMVAKRHIRFYCA